MARLDDIAAEVKDAALRKKLQDAIADLKRKQRFGLVFEEHIPETTALLGLPIQVRTTVQRREDLGGNTLYRVLEVDGRGKAVIEPLAGGETETSLGRVALGVPATAAAIPSAWLVSRANTRHASTARAGFAQGRPLSSGLYSYHHAADSAGDSASPDTGTLYPAAS